jgi:hypothetical protein
MNHIMKNLEFSFPNGWKITWGVSMVWCTQNLVTML